MGNDILDMIMGPAVYDSIIGTRRDQRNRLVISIRMGNEILDMIMGPAVYDSRIRPAGIKGTGE